MVCGTTGWEYLEGSGGCDCDLSELGLRSGESIWEQSDLREVWDRRKWASGK